MRVLLLAITIALFSAFTAQAYPIYGIVAGYNINGFKSRYLGEKRLEDWNSAYNIGFMYRTDGQKWRLQASLLYSPKGAKDLLADNIFKLRYVEIAAPFLYNTRTEGLRNWTISMGAGPYVSKLVSAVRATTDGAGGKILDREKMSIGSDSAKGVKGFDAGLTFYIGYKLGRFNTSISYDFGLANISTKPNTTTKNRTFAINFGYFIQPQGRKAKETR